MDKISNVVSTSVVTSAKFLYNSYDSVVNNTETNLNLMSNAEFLQLANFINNLPLENKNIKLPKLVVVGTQSSGKSSLLNGLLGIDVLPTGNNMTTKCPLHIELLKSTDKSTIEMGQYTTTGWECDEKININYPKISRNNIIQIKEYIETTTKKRTNNTATISSEPIFMKIYAPNGTNLSMVDLPGLTMVACTDRGQPKDMKERVRKLVKDYIQEENTIILLVMAARSDLETDIAFDLVKECDPNGERSIGVLTKIDLMNCESSIADYLLNRTS